MISSSEGNSWRNGEKKSRDLRTSPDVTVSRYVELLTELGVPLLPGAKILDFGCGDGAVVRAFRKAGFEAWGVDIQIDFPSQGICEIEAGSKLPFGDDFFDLIISENVVEHIVVDLALIMEEWSRVVTRTGINLHSFPPRTGLIEPHTFVPLASRFQSLRWLRIWAFLGIRAPHQKSYGLERTALDNFNYLRTSTKYLKTGELRAFGTRQFERVVFVEKVWLRVSARRFLTRFFARFAWRFPFLAKVYGETYYRVLMLTDPTRS